MPTVTQLPTATSVNAGDLLPISQGNISKNVAVSTLLSGTQPFVSPRIISAAVSAVTIQASDELIVINKGIGSATAVTLDPSPAVGAVHRIKDGKGDAATNPITITAAAGTIDGASHFVINQNRGAVTLEYTGSEWVIT